MLSQLPPLEPPQVSTSVVDYLDNMLHPFAEQPSIAPPDPHLLSEHLALSSPPQSFVETVPLQWSSDTLLVPPQQPSVFSVVKVVAVVSSPQ